MAAYRDKRRPQRPWVLDITYVDKRTGKKCRYFRNAKCQTADGARAEERSLLVLYAEKGFIPTRAELAPEPPKELTFKEAHELFLETKAPTLKPSTRHGYKKNLDAYLLPRFGHLPLGEIDRAKLLAFDQELAKDGLSTATRNNIIIPLRCIVLNAVELRKHDKAPDFPKLHKVKSKVFEPPRPQQVADVLEQAEPHERVALALAAYAGLRASELVALRWLNVNVETDTLYVREALTVGEVVLPKSGHQRPIPLAPALKAILEVAAKQPHLPTAYVAPSKTGAAWTPAGLRHAFKRALTKANVPHARLHDLRHFFITQCFAAGAGAPTVQRLAGHCHLSVTQRYAHTNDTLMREAVQGLGKRPA